MSKKSAHFQIIPVRKLEESEHRYYLISPDEILCAFVGTSLFSGLIEGPKIESHNFKPHRLYLQTVQGFYYSSICRSLRELSERLNPDLFLTIQKSLIVNIQKAKEIDFRERQIGIARADGSLLWLDISRRFTQTIRRRLFMSH